MKRKNEGKMTPEEKEILRRLMETPGIEKEWDFFEGMSPNVPPPEFFMSGRPKPQTVAGKIKAWIKLKTGND